MNTGVALATHLLAGWGVESVGSGDGLHCGSGAEDFVEDGFAFWGFSELFVKVCYLEFKCLIGLLGAIMHVYISIKISFYE